MEIELTQPKVLAKAVHFARTKAGLSQEKLAQKSNLSVRTIRLIESGKSDPREGTIEQICTALEIPSIVLRCMVASENDREKISKLLDIYYSDQR